MRSYEDLIEFNRALTADRAERFRGQAERLEREKEDLLGQARDLDEARIDALQVLRETDSFEKLRSLQTRLRERRTNLPGSR